MKYIRLKEDKEGCKVSPVDTIIGMGVFAKKDYLKGEFIVEYDGELITKKEGENREKNYQQNLGSYIFFYSSQGKKFCIDGTFSKRMGRYVNDAPRIDPQCNAEVVHLFIDYRPYLALLARRFIPAGEEIRYDYGVKNLPWRQTKIFSSVNLSAERKTQCREEVRDCYVRLTRIPEGKTGTLNASNDLVKEPDEHESEDTLKKIEEVESEIPLDFGEAASQTQCHADDLGDVDGAQWDSDLQAESKAPLIETLNASISYEVEKVWSQKSVTDFILAKVFGINITDRDIKSLQGTQWLTDQVIDGYLKLLCQAENDKGRSIVHIPVQAMTSICTGSFSKESGYFSKYCLTLSEIVLGVCHQGGNHWTLVILEPANGNFYFFDSFGYNEEKASEYLQNWSAFLRGRKMEIDISWKMNNKEHSIQNDGYNCGVFCLMFADRFLQNQLLTGIFSADLGKERRQIAENLLHYEIYLKHACPCCGIDISDEEKIPCISCKRNFHKKSYCVGDEYTAEEVTSILCRGCNQKMLVQDDKRRFGKEKDKETILPEEHLLEIIEQAEEYLPGDSVGLDPTESSRKYDGQDKFICGKCDTEFREIEHFLSHRNTSCLNKSTPPSMNTDKKDAEFEDHSKMNTDRSEESSVPAPKKEEDKNVIEKKGKPKRPCPFCLNLQSSLTKHIQRCHKNVEEVKSAMELPRPEKNRAFCNFKRQGIFKYNAKIMKSKDLDASSISELMKERSQSEKKVAMCSLCNAFISKSLMYRHARICNGAGETTLPPTGVALRGLLETEYPQDYNNFLEKFHPDEVGLVIRSDEFLKKFGHYEFKHLSQSKFKVVEKMNTLRSKLRRLARLFIHFKEIASNAGRDIKSCDELFKTDTISLLDEAVTKMTQDPESGDIKSGLKVGLRSLILEVCDSIYLTFSLKLEKQKALEIMDFQQVLKLYWKRYFSTAQEALATKRQSVSRAPDRLPSESDIEKLGDFIKENVQRIVEDVYSEMNSSLFCNLRNLLTCRLTLYNARRGGEAARLTLAEYKDAASGKWANEKSGGKIDEDLKTTCKLKCTYLHSSKKAELVPVLLPEDCWKGLDMLADVENRGLAHVHPNNVFIFANTGNSIDHVNGWKCVRDICDQAKISRSISATDMRHYVCTHYASYDVPQEERDFFIQKHLGHSKFINENVYQCPPALKEMRIAGKFLSALDSRKLVHSEKDTVVHKGDAYEDPDMHGNASEGTVHSEKDTVVNKADACEDPDMHGNTSEGTVNTQKRRRRSDELENQPLKRLREDRNEHNDDVSDDSESDVQSATNEDTNTESRKTSKAQARHQWSEEEDRAVQQFFSDEISDVSQPGNKGKLIIGSKVKQFIKQHPQILEDFTDSEKKTRIRVKVLNCRRRTRELYFKNLHKFNN